MVLTPYYCWIDETEIYTHYRRIAEAVSLPIMLYNHPASTVLDMKPPLIARLAERNPHLYQRDIERIVTVIFEEISAALSGGNRVELRGFGAYSVKRRSARMARNPRTGEAVHVAEKHVPFFKTGKELRLRLNGSVPPGSND